MIPTRYKAKLSRMLSWPIGAEAISEQLAGTPQVADLSLAFHGWWAHDYRRFLREPRPYPLMAVRYEPKTKPGYGGMNSMVEQGWYEARWEITVWPVFRGTRAVAGGVLRSAGLPRVAEWLEQSVRIVGWPNHAHRLELIFDPTVGTLTPRPTDGA